MDAVAGCPKTLKNGPCGGYKQGKCEVTSSKKCIFVAAWEKKKSSIKKVVG